MDWSDKPRTIQILVDNDSWILPFVEQLAVAINRAGDRCCLRRSAGEVQTGDVLLLLGCTQLVSDDVLGRNARNLVVHESALPEGRGFAPMPWQVIEGASTIEVCLLHAAEEADAGDVLLRHEIELDGTELCDQLRRMQGNATSRICMDYLRAETEPVATPQFGASSTYSRRLPADSQLDTRQSLADQFDLLRVCDNERYPAWFEHRGKRYKLKIEEVRQAADCKTLPSGSPRHSQLEGSCSQLNIETSAEQNETAYLVAGCKSWNREAFDRLSPSLPGNWYYAGDRDKLTAAITRLKPSKVFFLHWSWIVPQEILQQTECVCFHMTDLPYGRGGSPLQNLISRGHSTTKLSALQMTDELDAGPIYLKADLSLDGTAADILRRATELSFTMIEQLVMQPVLPVAQSGDIVKFSRRKPQQSELAGDGTLEQIYDHIRMLDGEGYPPAFLDIEGIHIEFHDAQTNSHSVEAKATITLREPKTTRRSA